MRAAERNTGEFLAADNIVIKRQRGIIALAFKNKLLASKFTLKSLAAKRIINNRDFARNIELFPSKSERGLAGRMFGLQLFVAAFINGAEVAIFVVVSEFDFSFIL